MASETTPAAASTEAEAERPSGPAAAVILATGVGALALGILTTINEASASVHEFLEFSKAVGPLAGKTIIAGAVFLASWALLTAAWRRANPALRPVAIATAVLVVLGLVGTFPLFFEAFASE